MDDIKRNNLHSIRVPEGKEKDKGVGGMSLFKYRMAKNVPK